MAVNSTVVNGGRKVSRKMSKPLHSTAAANPIFKNDALHLAFCVVGVVGSLLLYGVLQVCTSRAGCASSE